MWSLRAFVDLCNLRLRLCYSFLPFHDLYRCHRRCLMPMKWHSLSNVARGCEVLRRKILCGVSDPVHEAREAAREAADSTARGKRVFLYEVRDWHAAGEPLSAVLPDHWILKGRHKCPVFARTPERTPAHNTITSNHQQHLTISWPPSNHQPTQFSRYLSNPSPTPQISLSRSLAGSPPHPLSFPLPLSPHTHLSQPLGVARKKRQARQ
jgi:hypothetical protein